MSIPLNGRIAIVDDKFEQAQPLMNVLAQKQCPYVFYTGELKYLPDEDADVNDIRILFLDINLIDDATHPETILKSKLIPVLKRIISKNNYPYILIYWSRHETEYDILIKEIFENDLPDRRPIAFTTQNKLSYFNLEGEQTSDFNQNVEELFNKISKLLNTFPAYSCLLDWENHIHNSADKTLQEIFSSYHTYKNWPDNAEYLIHKLGEAYSGKTTFKAMVPVDKIRSSFQAFNNVFFDSLEYSINNYPFPDAAELKFNHEMIKTETIYIINKKLLISDEKDLIEYSGTVTEDSNSEHDKVFKELLNNSFNRKKIEQQILLNEANNNDERNLDKLIQKECSSKREEIRLSWKKINFIATPLCDYAQGKNFNARIVKGMLVKSDLIDFIDERSEAIFISPNFKFESAVYAIVLHFRYFFTAHDLQGIKGLKPLFRVRQQLLAEVQSKLARHISRQGVLFID